MDDAAPSVPIAPKAPIQLVVYDLDGTLLDAFEDIHAALNAALAEVRLSPYDLATVKSFVGHGVDALITKALGRRDEDLHSRVRALFMERYRADQSRTRLYQGISDLLRDVRGAGLRQAVITNKPHDVALRTVEKFDLDRLVDGVVGETPERPLKPDPAGLLALLKEFATEPCRAVLVGDGDADCEVGARAGVAVIGCAWGVTPPETLRALGVWRVVDSIPDLRRLLLSLR